MEEVKRIPYGVANVVEVVLQFDEGDIIRG